MSDVPESQTTNQPVDGTIEDVPFESSDPETVSPTTETTTTDTETPQTKKRRVRKWSSASSASFANALTRRDDVFVAPLDAPLYILSPTMRLQTALFDDDDDLCDYATFKMKSTHLATFRGVEDTLLDVAKANKHAWFGNDEITDAFLETSLKRFVEPEAKTITVKIHEGLSGRTNVKPGTRVKVVLACDHAIFTRTQFGVPWTMHVIRSIENDENMYLFDAEEDASYATVSNDLLSHLTMDRSEDGTDAIADAL